MKKSLTKAERLSRRRDIRSVFSSGRTIRTTGMHIRFRKNGMCMNRVLIAPTRNFGRAVDRNYVRRVGRELYRSHKHLLKTGYDIALVFLPGQHSFSDRAQQFLLLCEKSGLLGVNSSDRET